MADHRQTDEHAHETTMSPTMKRRGLIAGTAALVAGVLARQAAPAVEAANGDPLKAGNSVTATAPTGLTATISGTPTPALNVTNNFPYGTDSINAAIAGYANGANTPGVFGRSYAQYGVGVQGEAPNGTGVFGHTTGGGTGVSGVAVGPSPPSSGYGVFGQAYGNHALVGWSMLANAAGVLGVGGVANSIAVYGLQNTGTYAGYFLGTTLVQGDFSVTGSKNAALKHPDGSYRLVYCVESPESWLEDFGEGTLTTGKAQIAFDPEFAEFIHTDKYHVFLTEQHDHNALFVTNQSATGFEVHAKGANATTGTFSYRIVARRKDIKGTRLEKVTVLDPAKIVPVPGAKP